MCEGSGRLELTCIEYFKSGVARNFITWGISVTVAVAEKFYVPFPLNSKRAVNERQTDVAFRLFHTRHLPQLPVCSYASGTVMENMWSPSDACRRRTGNESVFWSALINRTYRHGYWTLLTQGIHKSCLATHVPLRVYNETRLPGLAGLLYNWAVII